MKLALYKTLAQDRGVVCESGFADRQPDYIRTTEYVETEFAPLPGDHIRAATLEALNRQRAAVGE